MKVAYVNGILLDGSKDMVPQKGLAVLTDGEKISSIVSKEKADLKDYELVDLQGKYLMPGLINLHVHIPATGKPTKKQTDAKKLVRLMTSNSLMRKIMEKLYKKYAFTELMSGVTTFRSVGGVENYDSRLRDKINEGKVAGPRILAGNMAISVPGGHMAGSLAYEATSEEEAASLVDRIAKDKPDLIKLMITGGVLDAVERGEPGIVKMKPEIVKAACEEAHKLGLPVAAHVESTEGVRIALENGVDTIEHGAIPDAEILQSFKDHKAVHVATLSPALPYALFPREVSNCDEMAQYNGKIVFQGIIECAKACLANDIPVGLGTDTGCPYITHYDMWRELKYFTKFCGVSNTFALYTATKGNAQIIGLGDITGSIEAGKCADFVVTTENPLKNYPVYTFIAPYQLHRFIELLKEEDLDLSGKYAAQITTSKHFYDITAHKYIKENCFDLKLRYVGGLSADMDDLLTKTGRTEAESFWKYILYCVEQDIYETAAIRQREAIPKYQASLPTIEKKADFPTAIVTNCEKEDESLAAMIADFVAAYPYQVKIINITDFPFSGGCLGCFHCATDGTCVYKDGFDSFLREKIQTNAAIVYAFSVKDHSMGATFKRYDDRQFCNGHRTVTAGMPMGYIVNGDYAGEANLQMIIEGRSEVGGNFLAGVATDSAGIEKLAHRLCYALENKLTLPKNFYGIGGMKIFRDLIYVMRGLMKADHKFYKKHGIYDFPQKKVGTIIKMKLVGGLLTNPKIKKKVGNKMNEGMIAPYKKAIEVGKKSN